MRQLQALHKITDTWWGGGHFISVQYNHVALGPSIHCRKSYKLVCWIVNRLWKQWKQSHWQSVQCLVKNVTKLEIIISLLFLNKYFQTHRRPNIRSNKNIALLDWFHHTSPQGASGHSSQNISIGGRNLGANDCSESALLSNSIPMQHVSSVFYKVVHQKIIHPKLKVENI